MGRLALLGGLLICWPLWAQTIIWGSSKVLPFDKPLTDLSASSVQVAHLLYDPLFLLSSEGEIVEGLAAKWSKLSPTHFRVWLRDDVRFHSGNRLTSADVVWSFNQHLKVPTLAAIYAPIQTVQALDTTTLDIFTYQPSASLLQRLSHLFVYDSRWYSQLEENRTLLSEELLASGTGPFLLTEHMPGIRSRLKRNSNDWLQNRSDIEELLVVPIYDPKVRWTALLNGDVDMAEALLPEAYHLMRQSPGLQMHSVGSALWVGLQFNLSHPLLSDMNVRRAISLAIDNEGVSQTLFGALGYPAAGLNPPKQALQADQAQKLDNVFLSHRLMEKAGITNDVNLTLIAPRNQIKARQSAEVLKEMLQRINVILDVQLLEAEAYKRALQQCRGDLFLVSPQNDGLPLPLIFGSLVLGRDALNGAHCQGFDDPYLSQRLDAAEQQPDQAAFLKFLSALESHLIGNVLVVPLYWQSSLWGVNEKFDDVSTNALRRVPVIEAFTISQEAD